MKKYAYKIFTAGSLLLLPLSALAVTKPNDFAGFAKIITDDIGLIVPILVALAVVAFLIGVVKYVFKADNEEERASGIKFITYGLVGLFIIVTVWSLVGILSGSFGIEAGIPTLQPEK